MTFAERVIDFYEDLDFAGSLPVGVQIMVPSRDNPAVKGIVREFYTRFYADHIQRQLILGINPGRFGAGATGIPFTDTRRLNEKCRISFSDFHTHEPSSVFIYDMIDAFGGIREFYSKFLISAICPLGFTITGKNGRPVNYNYYNSRALTAAVYPFIVETLKRQLKFGIDTSACFCLGTGKNHDFLKSINKEHRLFQKIIALEHPRYIMQYRTRMKQEYMEKYVRVLKGKGNQFSVIGNR
jgi:hypothetical protein